MWRGARRGDRRALRRRRRALHHRSAAPASRRSRPATTSASSRPSARTRRRRRDYGAIMHAHRRARSPPAAIRWSRRSTASASAAGSRSPRCATCASAATSSRFGAPIKNLGLVMAYAEMAPLVRLVGPGRRARDPARGPHLRRRRGEGEGPRHARRRRRRRSRPRRARPRERIADGAPLVARWHKKFARRLAESAPLSRGRARRVLRLLRHRGFPDRLRGVPREARSPKFAAAERRRVARRCRASRPARRACACSSSRRSWPARPAA